MNKKAKQYGVLAVALLGLLSLVFMAGTGRDVLAATQGNHNASITLGNNAPTIILVTPPVGINPTESSTTPAMVQFVAYDANGAGDLNDSTAYCVYTRTGEADRSAAAVLDTTTANNKTYNCTPSMYYYDQTGTWNINVSIRDNSAAYAENTTETFSYGSLRSMVLGKNIINFGTGIVVGTNDIAATNNPQYLNNTGNLGSTVINITGSPLVGQTNGAYSIGAGNVSINVSDSATGQALSTTEFQITSSTLNRRTASTEADGTGLENLYFYIDVPLGLTNQEYRTNTQWVLAIYP